MKTTINLASIKYLHELEELIFGNELANTINSFGKDLKYTEYGKIYKYNRKYYRAYKYLYKENGIYAPDLEYFMELKLGELSTVFNKIDENINVVDGGIYLPPFTSTYNYS